MTNLVNSTCVDEYTGYISDSRKFYLVFLPPLFLFSHTPRVHGHELLTQNRIYGSGSKITDALKAVDYILHRLVLFIDSPFVYHFVLSLFVYAQFDEIWIQFQGNCVHITKLVCS